MLSTWAEELFDDLKKFLSPRSIWQKVLVPQYDLLKSFGTPTTKLKIAQKLCFKRISTSKNNASPATMKAP